MITLLGQTALVLLLTYFLLVNDELLKRKLVENIGPTLTRKKITVQILNDISSQIERFLLVQILSVRSLRLRPDRAVMVRASTRMDLGSGRRDFQY